MLGKEFTMLQDLESYLTTATGNRSCKLRTLIESLDPQDAAILSAAVEDKVKWSTHGLHTALRAKGIQIGYQSLYRHRKNVCSCWAKNV